MPCSPFQIVNGKAERNLTGKVKRIFTTTEAQRRPRIKKRFHHRDTETTEKRKSHHKTQRHKDSKKKEKSHAEPRRRGEDRTFRNVSAVFVPRFGCIRRLTVEPRMNTNGLE
jgi:hypothetical protein